MNFFEDSEKFEEVDSEGMQLKKFRVLFHNHSVTIRQKWPFELL